MAQRFHRLPEPERTALASLPGAFELEKCELLKLDEEQPRRRWPRARFQNELCAMRASGS